VLQTARQFLSRAEQRQRQRGQITTSPRHNGHSGTATDNHDNHPIPTPHDDDDDDDNDDEAQQQQPSQEQQQQQQQQQQPPPQQQ